LDESLYAGFVVNSIATVGQFLISFYEKKYKNNNEENLENKAEADIIPF